MSAAFRREEYRGARLGFRVRLVGLVVLAAMVILRTDGIAQAYYVAILAVLALIGIAHFRLVPLDEKNLRFVTPARYAMVALDMALITFAILAPAPGVPEEWPVAMQLRLGNAGFLFVFLAFATMTYSPGLVLAGGLFAAMAWIAGALWVLAQPGIFTLSLGEIYSRPIGEIVQVLLDPNYVSTVATVQEAALLLCTAAVMAASVWRARQVALSQVEAVRARTNLARYFSPDLAERLGASTGNLERMRQVDAAVLFADIIGFTGHAEAMDAEETLRFLQRYHEMTTRAVFANGGTLNKFIGDEVMASFGALNEAEDAAASALKCALEIAESVAAWSRDRQGRGRDAVRVGIGLHAGPVVVGNIGEERCLELAVLGDTVNVASRLERATRDLGVVIVASAALVEEARRSDPDIAARLTEGEALSVKGRRSEIPIFTAGDNKT